MVEYDIEILGTEELSHHFDIVETFGGLVNRHSLKLKLPPENIVNTGEKIMALEEYIDRARYLGYSVKVEQIGEVISDPCVITHVTFSHLGLIGFIQEEKQEAA